MIESDLGLIVDACYAAALDSSLWPTVLAAISRAVGARGAAIVSLNPQRTASTTASDGLGEANADYQGGWWRFDTRIARAKALSLRPGIIAVDRHFLTQDDTRGDPFFEDFSVRHQLGEMAAYVALDPLDGSTFTLSAFRDARSDLYSEQEIRRLQFLAPHVVRARAFAAALDEARQRAANLERGLERMQFGTILLDRRACARHVNRVADGMMPGCLRLDASGRPHAVVADQQAKLDRLIAAALPDNACGSGTPVLMRCTGDRRPVFIESVPLGRDAASKAPEGGVLLLLRDVFAPASRSICPQLEQLGLTKAEARVAMLIGRGHAPREAAEMLHIAEGTVRVHLRASFSKLDLTRQSELAVLVTRLDDCARA